MSLEHLTVPEKRKCLKKMVGTGQKDTGAKLNELSIATYATN